jgi:outer membrane protein OmpA-like peptidoglycan-associated protein
MNIKLYLLAAVLLLAATGWSQNPKLKKADRAFEAKRYQEAIGLYQEVLEKNDLPDVKVKLGDIYRKMRDYANAEQWYSQAVTAPEVNPMGLYYYGKVLQYNDKCPEAAQWYQQFLRLRPYDVRKKHLQHACDYEEELWNKNIGVYTVELAGFNTPGADIAPAFYKNGLVFASKGRDSTSSSKSEGYFDLYFVEVFSTPQSFDYGSRQRFSDRLRSSYHDGIVTFNANFSEIFLTQSRKNPVTELKDLYPLEITRAQNPNDSVWSVPEPLPFNSDDYSVAHPALSPDGSHLFFSSDMPGGSGGKDLYVSEKVNGQWTLPINLGPFINTEGDEVFPFYQGGRLYFASEGHFGLGGMDIFYVEDLGSGDWSEVENLGAPINSEYDDFGIVVKPEGKVGYFTSNRPDGSGGDDIYSFSQSQAQAVVEFVDATTNAALPQVIMEQVGAKNIAVKRLNNQAFVNLVGGQCGNFSFQLPGYMSQTQQICASDKEKITIFLERIIPTLSGLVLDQNTGQPIKGVRIKLTGEKCGTLTATSDADGKYTFQLKDACCYQLRAEKDQFFNQALEETICVETGIGAMEKTVYLQPFTASVETKPAEVKAAATEVNLDFSSEEIKSFKRSAKSYENGSIAYLLNLYYDFGHASVRKEALPELDRLLKLLQDNPNLIVEISSHTDSRGDSRYNQKLSQRRADAVLNWLSQKGIKKERLVAIGYGETKLINPCEIEEDCSEEAHQLNRRTEFRVLGKVK